MLAPKIKRNSRAVKVENRNKEFDRSNAAKQKQEAKKKTTKVDSGDTEESPPAIPQMMREIRKRIAQRSCRKKGARANCA
jgi:hypothetical protein